MASIFKSVAGTQFVSKMLLLFVNYNSKVSDGLLSARMSNSYLLFSSFNNENKMYSLSPLL